MVHLRNELRFVPGQGENASQTGMNLRWKEALDLPERSGTPFRGGFLWEKSENGENSWIPHPFYAIIKRERLAGALAGMRF